MLPEEKLEKLRAALAGMGGVLVALSGGVDSTFLAKVAHDVLGERSLAVTITSQIHPTFEKEEAAALAHAMGIRHEIIDVDALSVEGLAENPPERCYICKKSILKILVDIAAREKLPFVVEGTNASDEGDFRPGVRALAELGIRSPLKDAGMTKADIRDLSCKMGLPTWNKPSYACLASRVPYGERITEEKLRSIERAEDLLRAAGYRMFRVRHHGTVARVELSREEMKRFLETEDLAEISRRIKACGFMYVALDLEGYRTGSLNETLAAGAGHKDEGRRDTVR
jgi:uncharacterized protein